MRFITVAFFLFLSASAFTQTVATRQNLFFEKVYLHLDREFYYSGEDIWYKAYLLNAQGNQLLSTSNNLYVELIDPNSQIKDRKVIRLENGLGKGDFKLGDSISPGTYRVRAYTNWMLNFGDNFIFEKKINVSADENLLTGSSKKLSSNNQQLASKSVNHEHIQFFPEGGSMVSDVTGIIAFKTDGLNKPKKIYGKIISSAGDTTLFESKHAGMGSFSFKPAAGLKYQVRGFFDDKRPFTASLPDVLSQGFSMHVLTDSVKTTVIISTNESTLNVFKDTEFEIRARHSGISYFTNKFKLSSVITKVIIPNNNMPEGIASITLTDEKQRPHSERLIFISKSRISDKLIIATAKPIYRAKEQITLRIKTTNSLGQPVKANLSLAVVDAGIVPTNTGTIVSYINLESEVRGKVDKPEQYFNSANPDRFKQLDLLLMTQGWRDFVWKRLKDTTLSITHLNEEGFTISGQVKEKTGDKPLVGGNVTLWATGAKGQKLVGATTDQTGRYYFDKMNLEGIQSIKLVSSDIKGKKTGRLFLDSLYSKPFPVVTIPFIDTLAPQLITFKRELASRSLVMKEFNLSDSIMLKEVAIKGSKTVRLFDQNVTTFGYPDQNFTITEKDHDYKSLRHYLLTNVNGASPDSSNETNGVVFFAQGKAVRPRFIIDRREDLFARMDFFDLDMKDVQKIVVRHMVGAPQGQLDSASGMSSQYRANAFQDVFLIYLTLKPSAFQKEEPSLLNAKINGYYQDRVFYEPRYYQSRQSVKKDVRTTIHWLPMLKTNDNGDAMVTYFNADPKTKVRIVAEGINDKGIPISGRFEYEVR